MSQNLLTWRVRADILSPTLLPGVISLSIAALSEGERGESQPRNCLINVGEWQRSLTYQTSQSG